MHRGIVLPAEIFAAVAKTISVPIAVLSGQCRYHTSQSEQNSEELIPGKARPRAYLSRLPSSFGDGCSSN